MKQSYMLAHADFVTERLRFARVLDEFKLYNKLLGTGQVYIHVKNKRNQQPSWWASQPYI